MTRLTTRFAIMSSVCFTSSTYGVRGVGRAVKRMREMGSVRFVVRGARGVGWAAKEKGGGWCTLSSMKFVRCGTQGLRRRSVRAGELSAERSKYEGFVVFRSMASGRYLVLSHQELAGEMREAWSDFEGTLDAMASMNAAGAAAARRKKNKPKL
jgi:hypothetical protein